MRLSPSFWLTTLAVWILSEGCSAPDDLELRQPQVQPRYLVGERDEAITIDGNLRDPGWARTHSTGAFRGPDGLSSTWTEARFLIDDEALYLCLEAQDWNEQTAIGVVIDVHGNFDPECDIWIQGEDIGQGSGTLAWDGPPEGSFAFREETSHQLHLEIRLPFAQLDRLEAPSPGDTWRVKLYRLDDPSAIRQAQIWSEGTPPPVESDEAYGFLEFLGSPLP